MFTTTITPTTEHGERHPPDPSKLPEARLATGGGAIHAPLIIALISTIDSASEHANQRLTDSTAAGGQDRPNGYYGGQPADVFSDILVRSTDSEQPWAIESFVRRLIYTQVLSLIGDSPHRKDRIDKAASE